MAQKTVDAIKTTNELPIKQVKQEPDYISLDAPPLDFSFKNIKHISQLKDIQPRQGEKKTPIHDQAKIKVQERQKQQGQPVGEGDDGEHRGDKKKNQLIKLLPQNQIGNIVAGLVNTSAMKNISLKAKQQLQKKKKKAIHVKLICASVMLSYNKIRELSGLDTVLGGMMENFNNLKWIDISHNYLTVLDYNFQHFTHLTTLYLHCNYLSKLAELQKLKHLSQLKTFTIHGNPLSALPNFRILTISILPDLKKLDSVLISKKQRDNAIFIRSQTKKYPVIQKPALPPQQKKQEDEEDKQ